LRIATRYDADLNYQFTIQLVLALIPLPPGGDFTDQAVLLSAAHRGRRMDIVRFFAHKGYRFTNEPPKYQLFYEPPTEKPLLPDTVEFAAVFLPMLNEYGQGEAATPELTRRRYQLLQRLQAEKQVNTITAFYAGLTADDRAKLAEYAATGPK